MRITSAVALAATAAMVSGLASGQPRADNPTDAGFLVQKIVETMGGEAAVAQVNSTRSVSTRHATTQYGDATISVDQITAYPDRIWMATRAPQFAATTVLTPADSFMITAGAVRELPANTRGEAARTIKLGLVSVAKHAKDPGYRFSVKGTERTGDLETAVLEIVVSGDKATWNVDPSTGRVLRATRTGLGYSGMASETTFEYSDWRTVDGLSVPFRIAQSGSVSAVDEVTSFEINPPIPPGLFDRPSAGKGGPDGTPPPTPTNLSAPTGAYINQRFSVVSPGLAVAVCDTFDSNAFAVNSPTLPIRIENGVAKYSRSDPFESGGFFGKCNGVVAEPLTVGEVVVVAGSKIHGHEFRLRVVSAPHAIRRGVGAFEHASYESGAAELRFKLDDPTNPNGVDSAIKQWLRPTTALPGNTASGIQVPQIREGMSVAAVESTLGAPDLRFDSEGSTTYRYKSMGVVVVFTDGKVSKIVTAH
ncbi:MAG: hypothetical protein ABSF98_22415 [Bryobacteraceae bacterium]